MCDFGASTDSTKNNIVMKICNAYNFDDRVFDGFLFDNLDTITEEFN